VELLHVDAARLAREVTFREDSAARPAILLAILIALRAAAAVTLPLSFDEAYYWRWSQHLAPGYWDHPPLIAFVIRAGTAVFGNSLIGVRIGAFLLSLVATWAVWRSGALLLQSAWLGLLAALFFNLTLMVNVEGMVATPDAPAMAFSALFVYALAEIARGGRGVWWIAAGAAAGLAMLSKYTAPFLALGALLWLIMVPEERRWLRSAWPYFGAGLALFLFLPNLVWNADNGWISFSRQFGRAGTGGGLTARFLLEFLGAQIALASPFIFFFGVAGFARGLRTGVRDPRLGLIAAMLLPAVLYFVWHSLHARVQGNWPSFLYPVFSIAAAAAWHMRGHVASIARKLAVPVALVLIGFVYVQALTGIVPLARDPVNRQLAVNYAPVAAQIEALRKKEGAGTILTTGYAQTGWLSFYLPSNTPVIQINERDRWLAEPPPQPWWFEAPALYVTESWRDQAEVVRERFAKVTPLARIPRLRGGRVIEEYVVYRAERPVRSVLGQK
jgi:4-amino-4-deoxy-L-arabinose transferase-like glycosyltransferase